MEPIRFAIIGCGLIGRKRATALPAGTLLYACDLEVGRATQLAGSFSGCQAITDYRTALQDKNVGAVIVSAINAALAPIALAAVEAGKHVLVEKPGGLTPDDMRRLKTAASAAGVCVRIGYNHRFHPALQQAKTLVDSGALGPLLFIRGRYGHGGRVGYDREWRADPALSGGGELIDQGVHLIDLAAWFLGPFTRVDGHTATYYWDMPVDDNAFLNLRTSSGQTAWLHVSCSEWKNLFSFEIYGRDGKIAIDGLGGSYGVERAAYYKMLPEMGPPETTIWEFPRGDASWALETQAFVEDIQLSRRPSPGIEEGLAVLEIVETIYQNSPPAASPHSHS